MYVSGTRSLQDLVDDLGIPAHHVDRSERYALALAHLTPQITTVVGHSLGGAAAARLTEVYPQLRARVYGAPLLRATMNPRVQSFRHWGDPISIFDRSATVSPAPGLNPHTFQGF